MARVFHPLFNTIAKASIFGGIFLAGGGVWVASAIERSSYVTDAGVFRDQPVPFSHEHHVSGLGIDCRYCHTSVRGFELRGNAADQDLHDLPFEDLDQRVAARAGAGELAKQHADPLAAGE